MRQLPEICEFRNRQIHTLERCVVLTSNEEERVAEVTFKKSVTEGVLCLVP